MGGELYILTNTFILLTSSFLFITISMNVGWAVGDEESVIVEKKSVSQKQRLRKLWQNFAFQLIERIELQQEHNNEPPGRGSNANQSTI